MEGTQGKIGTHRLTWQGREVSVEARVEGNRVRIYSYREVRPEGYVVTDREDKHGGPRGGMTDHDLPDEDTHLGEGDHATALAAWSVEDRHALAVLVIDAARRRA